MSSDTTQHLDVGASEDPELPAPQTLDELATEVLLLRTLVEDLAQGADPRDSDPADDATGAGRAGGTDGPRGDDDLDDAAGEDVDEELQWAWRRADADDAELLWAKLRDFVAWLVERYELGGTVKSWSVPGCWWQHPVAVEELTALMASWESAYWITARVANDDLIAWHDRWLWPCLDRLAVRAGWGGCKDSTGHQRSSGHRWDIAPGFDDHVAADVAARRDVVGSRDGAGDDAIPGETTTRGQTEPGAH